jgi:sigma-E factor negative regulatory protein RseC
MSTESRDNIGIVRSIDRDVALVEILAGGGCSSCSMNMLCGASKKSIRYQAKAPFKVAVNDMVQVDIVSGSKILSALIVFLIPVLFLIFGYIIGTKLGLNEGLSILVALVSLGISMIPVKILDKFYGKKISYEIVKILPDDYVVEPVSCERNEQ